MIVIVCGPLATGKTTITMYERVAESETNWLLDGTFYQREWRERFRELNDVRIVYVHAPLETALERNREQPID